MMRGFYCVCCNIYTHLVLVQLTIFKKIKLKLRFACFTASVSVTIVLFVFRIQTEYSLEDFLNSGSEISETQAVHQWIQ